MPCIFLTHDEIVDIEPPRVSAWTRSATGRLIRDIEMGEMAGFNVEAFKEQLMLDQTRAMDRLMSEQTRAMEQLKTDMAEQTRAIIWEIMGEMMGTVKHKQPVQQ